MFPGFGSQQPVNFHILITDFFFFFLTGVTFKVQDINVQLCYIKNP